jgi:hypothetical protein
MNPKRPDEDFEEAVGIAQAEECLLSQVNPDDYLGETIPGHRSPREGGGRRP